MSNEASLAGYVLYLCEIFVPGIGIGELLNAWGNDKLNLAQRMGLAFGIGVSADTVVLAVRTSGVSIGGIELKGIDPLTLYFIISIGAASLCASLVSRRKFLFPVRPSNSDAAVVVVMGVLAVMVWLIFQKYPIFPEFARPDFGNHLKFVEGLISGSTVTIPRGILYFGVHYQLASALVFVGGEPFVTMQRTMGLLVVLSPLLVYLGAAKLFSSTTAGLAAIALYVFSGAVWFDSVFDSGLYANFFGLLFALFFIAILLELSEQIRSIRYWLLFAIVVTAAYFSHYTIITILPAILAVPIIQYARSRSDYKKFLIPSLASIAPAAIIVAIRPRIVHLLQYFAESSGGSVSGSTVLSSALAFLPVLGYLAVELNDDVGFVFLVLFAGVYTYRGLHSKSATIFIPLLWLAALLLVAPQNVSAWRYSYEAMLPLILMGAYGAFSLLPKLKMQRRRGSQSNAASQYAKVGFVLLLMLTPMVVGSWGTAAVSDAVTETQAQAQSQQSVYQAMNWLKDNTPTNSTYLSITDWRFYYTYLFVGRNTTYLYIGSESQAVEFARQQATDYIIVTYVTTLSLPVAPQDYPWFTFQPSSNLALVYSNSDVKVFQLT